MRQNEVCLAEHSVSALTQFNAHQKKNCERGTGNEMLAQMSMSFSYGTISKAAPDENLPP